jgi:hypothetical protein
MGDATSYHSLPNEQSERNIAYSSYISVKKIREIWSRDNLLLFYLMLSKARFSDNCIDTGESV